MISNSCVLVVPASRHIRPSSPQVHSRIVNFRGAQTLRSIGSTDHVQEVVLFDQSTSTSWRVHWRTLAPAVRGGIVHFHRAEGIPGITSAHHPDLALEGTHASL